MKTDKLSGEPVPPLRESGGRHAHSILVKSAAAVLLLLLAAALLCGAAAAATSGDSGNIHWVLDGGTLTISAKEGTDGAMPNYSGNAPWSPNYEQIERVEIKSGVTTIGNSAFSGCIKLSSISFAANSQLQTIGNSAFYGCWSLSSITLPSSLTSIGEYAFRECINLKSVSFDADSQLETIGEFAFYDCRGLSSITLPSSLTSIGESAFVSCSGLSSVSFGANSQLKTISENAFCGCSGLSSVSFGANSQLQTIGKSAFQDCGRLSSITLPSGLTSIGEKAFAYCSGLSSITLPSSLTSIGNSAFAYCSGLSSITLPSSLTSIGESAFYYCSSLSSVSFGESSKLETISKSAFKYCSGLSSVSFGDNSQLETIGESAFSGCSSLSLISFSDNSQLETIGKSAFMKCSSLSSVSFGANSQLETIGEGAFFECGRLSSITLPSSLTSIGNSAFFNCWSLSSITLPSGLTSIGEKAFACCSGLSSLSFADNSKLETIGTNVFEDCSSLSSISFGNNSSLKKISDSAFTTCHGLSSVSFGADSQLNTIGNSAFSGCSNLKSVSFGADSQLKTIGDSAFYGCSRLSSITLPSGVTDIGKSAFYGCSSLTSINFESENAKYTSDDGILFSKDGSTLTLIQYPIGKQETSYEIPASVTTIGNSAFEGGNYLEVVTAASGSQLMTIGDSAFKSSSRLFSIALPSNVTNIGTEAFSGCSSLSSVSFDDNSKLETIGTDVFRGCISLSSLSFGANSQLKSIGDSAFSGCSNLERVSFGANSQLETIGNSAFSGCSSLASIAIPSGITTIGESAFSGCSSLSSITLPPRLTTIGTDAFQNLSENSIIYYSTPSLPLSNTYTLSKTAIAVASGDDSYIFNSAVQTLTFSEKNAPKKDAFPWYEWYTAAGETVTSISAGDDYATGKKPLYAAGKGEAKSWTDPHALPAYAGFYKLETDVSPSPLGDSSWNVPYGKTTLDLNGHVIDLHQLQKEVKIPAGSSLTVCDSNPNTNHHQTSGLVYLIDGGLLFQGNLQIDGGTLIVDSGTIGSYSISITNGGTLALYAGGAITSYSSYASCEISIDKNCAFTMNGGKLMAMPNDGGGVSIQNSGTFTMDSGTISYSRWKGGVMGVIFNTATGTFTMNGGEISNNTAIGSPVIRNDGMFTMTGGKITRNEAKASSEFTAAAELVYCSTVRNSGTFVMSGGEISNNTTDGFGGGLYIETTGVAELKGDAKITGNAGKLAGGGVFINANGWSSGRLTISGNAEISGNTPDDVYPPAKGDDDGELDSARFDENGTAVLTQSSIITSVTVTPNAADTLIYNRNNGIEKPPVSIGGTGIITIGNAFVLGLQNGIPSGVPGVDATLSGKLEKSRLSGLQDSLRLAQKTDDGEWQLLPVSNRKIEDSWYTFTAAFTSTTNGRYAFVLAEEPASIPIKGDTATFPEGTGEIRCASGTGSASPVSGMKLTSISGVTGEELTFADRTYDSAYCEGLNGDGRNRMFIGAFDVTSEKASGSSIMTLAISVNSGWEPENIRFIHGQYKNNGIITWDSGYLESSYDPVKKEYTVTTSSFSPFAIVYADPTPAPKKSSSTTQGTSVWLTAEPTPTETPAPTETPGTPEAPSVKPVASETPAGKSPAPVMGVIAGLGCAAVLFGLRRR